MAIKVLYAEEFVLHDPYPHEHIENPERLETVLAVLKEFSGRLDISRPSSPPDLGVFAKAHEQGYVEWLLDKMRRASSVEFIDPDTYISPGTMKAVEALSSSIVEALESIEEASIVILGRPPGHHAGLKGPAMGAPTLGFCVFNTAAILAKLLSGRGRVAVLDFDLHHGNGSQEILWNSSRVYHIDIHQDPSTIYPGTGYPSQIGAYRNMANIVVPPWSGDDIYEEALGEALGIVSGIDPDYLVVSAGFDAYRDEPLTAMNVGSKFYWLLGSALNRAEAKLAIVLEGGYGLGLQNAWKAFISGLLGKEDPIRDTYEISRPQTWEKFRENMEKLREHLGLGKT